MKMISFKDVPQFPYSSYHVDVGWTYLKEHLERWADTSIPGGGLEMNPDFQRGHVWTEDQQKSYIEYCLKGGTTGKEVYFNCSSWGDKYNTPVYCVDGLQRITAVLAFLDNKIPAFGHFFKDFGGKCKNSLSFNVLKVRSKKELLKVYVDFNSGGTAHNPEEIKRVEKMIEETSENETL